MKYYVISISDDLKIIGNYPQTDFKKDFNFRSPNSYRNVHPFEFPDFDPDLQITIHKKAKPTDFLDFSGLRSGSIVSAKGKSLIQKFNLPPHRFYPIKVYHRTKLLDYYWLHFIVDIWEFTDIKKSSAQVFNVVKSYVKEVIPIPNFDSIKNLRWSLNHQEDLKINILMLNDNHPNYDVLKVTRVEYSNILFSDRLVQVIENEGLTGIEKNPYDKIICP